MSFTSVTAGDLERSRQDRAFRQRLLQEQLGALLTEMQRRKQASASPNARTAAELREAAALAVRMADIIKALEQRPDQEAAAS